MNVSIDSLQRDRFFQLTRRDSLPQVLRVSRRSLATPKHARKKVNAVAIRGFTEEEAIPFAQFARSTAFQVRFIEFMPLDADGEWTAEQVLTGEELRRIIDSVHPLEERPRIHTRPRASFASATARARSRRQPGPSPSATTATGPA